MEKVIVVRFGELWLKGKNRDVFVQMLRESIESRISGIRNVRIVQKRDRFVIYAPKRAINRIKAVLGYTFGISWYGEAYLVKNRIKEIIDGVSEASKLDGFVGKSVRIDVHRSFKQLNFTSKEVISAMLSKKASLPFTMDRNSDISVFVNPDADYTYIHAEKIVGLGGMPYGSSGKAVALVSGGIDSPVAAFYAMKRGLELIYLHIHPYKDSKTALDNKMDALLSELSKYSGKSRVYLAPAYLFEAGIIGTDPKIGVVLFKCFMMRLAEILCEREKCDAIVTGESLAQVSSQTIRNLYISSRMTDRFVFRPLIGFDKGEIVVVAKKIKIYEVSILKYRDVCAFNSKSPTTSASPYRIKKVYSERKNQVWSQQHRTAQKWQKKQAGSRRK